MADTPQPPQSPLPTPKEATKASQPAKLKIAAPAAPPDPAQMSSYRYPDKRKNNPEVGLVNEASDPEQAKTLYAYDAHLDPVLRFDSARAEAEKLIDDALAGNDPAALRSALETLRRMSSPYLQWTGKAERPVLRWIPLACMCTNGLTL
jgi:adenine-specific DNA-methyltransferase